MITKNVDEKGGTRWNIEVVQGADFEATITVYQTGTTTARDITGYVFAAEIRDKTGGDLIETFTAAITDAPNGKFKLSLTDVEARAMSVGGVYDVKMKDGSNIITRLLWGRVTLAREVSTNLP